MGNKFLKFGDAKFKKLEFHSCKSANSSGNIIIEKITISNRSPCSKNESKYFVSYIGNEKVTPLCVLFPKMSR